MMLRGQNTIVHLRLRAAHLTFLHLLIAQKSHLCLQGCSKNTSFAKYVMDGLSFHRSSFLRARGASVLCWLPPGKPRELGTLASVLLLPVVAVKCWMLDTGCSNGSSVHMCEKVCVCALSNWNNQNGKRQWRVLTIKTFLAM